MFWKRYVLERINIIDNVSFVYDVMEKKCRK